MTATEIQFDLFGQPQPQPQPAPNPTPPVVPKAKAPPKQSKPTEMHVSPTDDVNCLYAKLEGYREQMKGSNISSRMLHIWAVMQPTDVMTDVLETLQSYADSVTEGTAGNKGRFTRILNEELALRETGKSNERTKLCSTD